jgi:hypothetical protein
MLVLAHDALTEPPPTPAYLCSKAEALHIFNGGHLFALTEKEQVATAVHAFHRNDSQIAEQSIRCRSTGLPRKGGDAKSALVSL